MTVRVVEAPDAANYKIEWTCDGCDARLEASGADIRVGEFGAMGDYDKMFYVECPRCATGKTWELYGSDLPKYVQHEAQVKQ